MIKKIHYFVIALTLSTGVAYAQVRVSGVVRDSEGPVAGASVVLKGTSTGISSGSDGSFTLSVPDANKGVLEVRLIGMTTVEYPLQGRTSGIEITLHPDATSLEDIVVLGYGNTIRANLTGSVGSISGAELARIPVASAAEALVGKIAGVQVTTFDGSPGSEVNIRIRGGTSVTQSNQPLFIVDGFPVANINDIPPTDIQSIDVLKDASMTAIYGARGANGVVIVTTKAAKAGKMTLNFNHTTQIRKLSRKLDVMNPYEFVKLQYEHAVLEGNSQRRRFRTNFGHPLDIPLYQRFEGNDWQEDVLGGSPKSRMYNLTMGGGSENLRFNISFTHNDEKGVLIGSGVQRTNLNTKINANLFPNVKILFNPRLTYRRDDGLGTDGMDVLKALRYRPHNGLREFTFIPPEEMDPEEEKVFQYTAPSGELSQNFRARNQYTFQNQGSVEWEIIKGLTARSEGMYGLYFDENDRFWGTLTGEAKNNNNQPTAQKIRGRRDEYRWANSLNYNFSFDNKHHFVAMVGQELSNRQNRENENSVRYLPTEIEPEQALNNFSLGTPWKALTTLDAPERMLSFFGRLTYNYEQRYLITTTFRADGSTMFAPGRQWGYFPAISGAWVLTREDFMKNQDVFSLLKARIAFGIAGNNRISADSWRYLYSISTTMAPGWGEINDIGWEYYQNAGGNLFPNNGIKWETTLTRNFALDIELFDGRLAVTPEAYWNTTSDLLYRSEIPIPTGHKYQIQNIGQVTNRGWELTINGNIVQRPDFYLNGTFNFGANKTRVDNLNGNDEVFYSRSTRWNPTEYDYILKVGDQLGLIYGYVYDGFYTLDDFEFNFSNQQWEPKPGVVNCDALFGTRPGAPKYKNLVDNRDGDVNDVNRVNEADLTVIGNTNPKFGGGFGLNGAWRDMIDFSCFFNYLYGFDVHNANKYVLSSFYENSNNFNNLLSDFNEDKRFRYVNDAGINITGAKFIGEYIAINQNASIYNPRTVDRKITHSYCVEDGSFLRLQEVTLGFTFPQRLTQRIGVNRLRLYFSGYNLWLWTKYSGYDPEVDVQSGLTPGIDYNRYPRSRNYVFGVNLTF